MMKSHTKARGTPCIVAAALAVIGGCNVGPNYKPPEIAVLASYTEAGGASSTQPSRAVARPIPVVEWWTTFRDPELDGLIDRAVKSNLNLRQAESRLRQARAQRGVIVGSEFPEIDADGGYQHARGSRNVSIGALGGGGSSSGGGSSGGASSGGSTSTAGRTARPREQSAESVRSDNAPAGPQSPLGAGGFPGVDTDLWQVGFDTSWEIDVFGGVRRNVEAADADVAAAIEDRRDVLVSLLAEVARDYIELRGYQRQAEIAHENLRAQQDTLEITRDRFRNGVGTQLDVARAAAQVATTAAVLPALNSSIRQSIHAVGLLLAEQPQALSDELMVAAPIPTVPPEVPVGLPSELLRRRPDVRRAERRLASATARVGVATADLFPRFKITAALGLDSTEPKHLFDYGSRYYDIVPGFSWPIFDAGRIRSNIRVQNELQQQAVSAYQFTVLTALHDVEDALVVYDDEQARRRALADAVEANKQAVELAQDQYKQGIVDFLTVLESQRSLFAAQDELVRSERAVSGDLVALYKALGGGWEIEKG